MPRYARIHAPGTVQHLISRFVDREFRIRDALDRRSFLSRLANRCRDADWRVLGYALMSNHIHLILLAGELPVGSFIHPVHSGFANMLNRQERRIGPVFAGRPTVLIASNAEDTFRLLSYVHNNPVRARVVGEARSSHWTSHRIYCDVAPRPDWLDVTTGLRLCGFDDSITGRAAFDRAVLARAGDPRDPEATADDASIVRRRARRAAGSAVEIESPATAPRTIESLAFGLHIPPDASVRIRWPGSLAIVVEHVARLTKIAASVICSSDRQRNVVRARRIVMLAAVRHLNRAVSDTAAVLGISAQAGGYLLRINNRYPSELDTNASAVARYCWETVHVSQANTPRSRQLLADSAE